MLVRLAILFAILGAVSISLAGCSNSAAVGGPSGLTNGALHPVSTAAAANVIDIEAELSSHTMLSGRMLTAIALERVTGRKPDPARFSQ